MFTITPQNDSSGISNGVPGEIQMDSTRTLKGFFKNSCEASSRIQRVSKVLDLSKRKFQSILKESHGDTTNHFIKESGRNPIEFYKEFKRILWGMFPNAFYKNLNKGAMRTRSNTQACL